MKYILLFLSLAFFASANAQVTVLTNETKATTIFLPGEPVLEEVFVFDGDSVFIANSVYVRWQCAYDATDSGFEGYFFESKRVFYRQDESFVFGPAGNDCKSLFLCQIYGNDIFEYCIGGNDVYPMFWKPLPKFTISSGSDTVDLRSFTLPYNGIILNNR